MKNPSRTYEEQGISFSISLNSGKQHQASSYVPDLKPITEGTKARVHDWLTLSQLAIVREMEVM